MEKAIVNKVYSKNLRKAALTTNTSKNSGYQTPNLDLSGIEKEEDSRDLSPRIYFTTEPSPSNKNQLRNSRFKPEENVSGNELSGFTDISFESLSNPLRLLNDPHTIDIHRK